MKPAELCSQGLLPATDYTQKIQTILEYSHAGVQDASGMQAKRLIKMLCHPTKLKIRHQKLLLALSLQGEPNFQLFLGSLASKTSE